jgi:lysozyme family protein
VTQGTFDLYRTAKGLPAADVREISKETAAEVYRSLFWEPAACPFLTWRLALLHFDTAVQRGAVKANRMLQEILGVKQDGMIGPNTLRVIAICEEESVIRNYFRDRERHYEKRVAEAPDQAVFLAGWRNRLAHLAKELNLA